ncbi:response regulator [Arthrobacter sp. 18067]|uniref:response regulator n=1 Tax=Arthrobacter sp. 18067 TaxID=2681413 RepID=UPI00135C7C6D|nr:response regulator [Arthrobacter sp. 18067]
MSGLAYHRYVVAAPRIQVDIIEDHAVLSECLSAWIGMKAPDIVVVGRFGSWAEASADLDSLSDVVVLDILLGDTIPLQAKIRVLLAAGSSVVVLSAVADVAVIRQVLDAGASAYVCKTEAIHTLLAAIRSAARGEQHTLPQVTPGLSPLRIRLTARELEAATLYFTDGGVTTAEVGTIMGVTVHTAKKLLMAVNQKARIGDEQLTRLGVRQRLIDEGLLIIDCRCPDGGPSVSAAAARCAGPASGTAGHQEGECV